MTFLVPIAMWGWILVNIILFRLFTSQKAILISIIGGVLFLPVATFDLPMVNYTKVTAIAVSLMAGILFSGRGSELAFRPGKIDIPIFVWCIIGPFLSIMANGLGLYNAVAAVIQTSLTWGVFYLAGRIYFFDQDALRLLTTGIIIGGLLYVPLILFELRMSPQLSNIFYGFFPHSFLEHIRYGGYRPVVFMDNGLMLALWMSVAFIISFWLYRSKEVNKIQKIPMVLTVILLLVITLLCKTHAPILYAMLGSLSFIYYKRFKSKKLFQLLILSIPLYIILRVSGSLSSTTILSSLSVVFDPDRIRSLEWRLMQEELFGINILERPFLGWGWMDRAWPLDSITGRITIQMIDSLYLIVFSIRGYVGLISVYTVLLLGSWKIMKSQTISIDAIVLSIILIMFTIDSLINGMVNPVFILTAGALMGFSERLNHDKLVKSEDIMQA